MSNTGRWLAVMDRDTARARVWLAWPPTHAARSTTTATQIGTHGTTPPALSQ